ncbi:uncharacterized protein UHOD_12268 [Ustilago sp. UG-2017b]|nr:uncharacterized protein UHOD_12268 [Ustilago sp. UG-2017b]
MATSGTVLHPISVCSINPSPTPSHPLASPGATLAVPDASGTNGSKGGRPLTGRTISGSQAGHLAPWALPAVVSSTLAVEVKVFDDSDEDGSNDEMNGSSNLLERTLRPRGLSDSSVRSTFIDRMDGVGAGPVSPAADRIRPSPISHIITPATLSLHSAPSAAATVPTSDHEQDKRSVDGNASPSVASEKSRSLTPGASGIAGGVASSIFSRSEKVLSFLSGGVVGSGAPIQPSSASTSPGGPTLRQTPSIAALNKAAARGTASQDLSVSPRNVPTIQASSSDSRSQAGLGLGLPQRPALGGAGSRRAGF